MKPPIAAALCASTLLVAPAAFAQTAAKPGTGIQYPGTMPASAAPTGPNALAKKDGKVFAADAALPEPVAPDQLPAATIALPNEPLEPYLLSKDNGPFMVMAKTFRGPEAERYALALVLELRKDFGLPAYIVRMKDFPLRSMIRNVPPTAPAFMKKARLVEPEKVRSFDEATVLVGDEKTLAGSEALLKRVKAVKPKCLTQMPAIFGWRQGLSAATRTTNPYVPTQDLFPGRTKKDQFLIEMNNGPRSVNHCPGRFSLVVAEFGGRSVYNPGADDARLWDNGWLRKSPLQTAGDDAEKLAENLSKDPQVRQAGYQPYVYHSRTSSKVMMGSFTDPNDPAAGNLRRAMLEMAVPLSDKKRAGIMIAPANALTDLEDPEKPIKTNR